MKVHRSLLQASYSLIVTMAVGSVSQAETISISTAVGDGADAFVRGGTAHDFNYGGENTIDIRRTTAATDMRKAYLRFDLGTIGNAAIESVSLNLNFFALGAGTGNSHTFRLYGLPDVSLDGRAGRDSASANGGWGEGTANVGSRTFEDDGLINWDRAPSNVTSSPWQFGDGAILLGLFTLQSPGLAEISQAVLSQSEMTLAQFLAQDTNDRVTFMLSSETVSTSASSRFFSKEGAVSQGNEALGPTLNLTTQAVPEPRTIALLAIGCVALFGTRGLRSLRLRYE